LHDRGFDDEVDEDLILRRGNNTARIRIGTRSKCVSRSRLERPIHEVPEEFREQDTPDTGPQGVNGGEDGDELRPLMPDEFAHRYRSLFVQKEMEIVGVCFIGS